MVLGTLFTVKFTVVNWRCASGVLEPEPPVAPDGLQVDPLPVLVPVDAVRTRKLDLAWLDFADALLVVELWRTFASDGTTAVRVSTVARPRVAAVVVKTTDFFMVVTFLVGGVRLDLR